jgi:two-component system phosphate regulon response regulator PhoB
MSASILVVEDEPAIQELLRVNLEDAGFSVRAVADAETAQAEIRGSLPTCYCSIGCYRGNPVWPSPARCVPTRARGSCRSSWSLRVARGRPRRRTRSLGRRLRNQAIQSARELKARIKSVLRRRAPEAAQEPLNVGPLALDPATHRLTGNSATVQLGPTEFRLLKFLMARPERVHSRAQLLDQVWGDHVYIEERTVDVHIRRLRLALEPHGCAGMIATVRGRGYRLAAPN